jgi:hypothetical protein
MGDVPAWIAAIVSLVALGVAWLAYRSQRNQTRIEYFVVFNRDLLPGAVSSHLQVTHEGTVLTEPSVSVVRIVNTGDRAIAPESFTDDLCVQFEGVGEIASATWTATRPPQLQPAIEVDGDRVRIKPTLINPEDMLELQAVCDGRASQISLAGRVVDLKVKQRERLPYPPGTGAEGEMLGFDRLMWFFLTPAFGIAVGIGIAFREDLTATARVLTLLATAIIVGLLYPLYVRHLVRRRRVWRP